MMRALEEIWNGYLFSTDKQKLNIPFIHQWLSEKSYWAQGIPEPVVTQSINNSLTFGIFKNGEQVGFARMVTDYATFAYLADVFIAEPHRKTGLSKHLMNFIFQVPEFAGMRRIILATLDAHSLYEKFGFRPLAAPERFMEIARPEIYKQNPATNQP